LNLDVAEQLIKSGDPNWRWKLFHYPINFSDEVRLGKEPLKMYPGGFAPILSGPTGFMRIKRSVFSKLMADNPTLNYRRDDGGIPWRLFHFDIAYDEQRMYNIEKSEDLSFCELCSKSGIQCMVDVIQPLTHCGDYDFEGNFGKCLDWGNIKK